MNKRQLQSFLTTIFLVSSGLTFAEPPADLVAIANSTVICGFNDNVLPDQASVTAQAAIQTAAGKGRHVYTTTFRGFSAHMSATAAAKLVEHNPNIAFCEQNGLGQAGGIPAQAGAKGGNGGKPGQEAEQRTPWGVDRVWGTARGNPPLSGVGKYAWIIDSGIDTDHPDLNVAPELGDDFVTGKGKDTVNDGNGHGTHVAGTLAAINNDIDVVGVAAGATVIPVRVLHTNGWATVDDMVAGIDFVAANANPGGPGNRGEDVANMSIWAYGHYRSLHTATLGLADVIPFVIIAGNDSENINDRPSEPSHVVHENLYVVSAIEKGDVYAAFSNYGRASYPGELCNTSADDPYLCGTVNVAAPGREVESLKPGGGLATWYGTSMAAPHVAGVILATGTASSTDTALNDPDGLDDPIVEAK